MSVPKSLAVVWSGGDTGSKVQFGRQRVKNQMGVAGQRDFPFLFEPEKGTEPPENTSMAAKLDMGLTICTEPVGPLPFVVFVST